MGGAAWVSMDHELREVPVNCLCLDLFVYHGTTLCTRIKQGEGLEFSEASEYEQRAMLYRLITQYRVYSRSY